MKIYQPPAEVQLFGLIFKFGVEPVDPDLGNIIAAWSFLTTRVHTFDLVLDGISDLSI